MDDLEVVVAAADLDQLVLLQEQEVEHSEVEDLAVLVEVEVTAVEAAVAVHQPVEVRRFQ